MNIKKMKHLLHRPGNAFLSSLFWSYFILSMTLLAINIPILTFTGRNTAKQNRLNNNYIVSNNQAYFDDALGDIKSLTMSLFFSDIPSKIINTQITSPANYYDTTELKKYITDHSLQIPIPFSVSFYMPDYNLIVSPLGINAPEKYYINNYCGNGYEGWLESIKNGDEFSTYSYERDGVMRRKLIYRYNSSSFPGSKGNPIIFFAEIDDDIFTAKMAEIQKKTSHLFVISDTNNNIILSNDKDVTGDTSLEDIFPHSSYIYTEKMSSAAGNIKYTLISPNSVAASPEKQVRLLITVDLTICLLFALGYSIFSMKKHGSPVVSLINEISAEDITDADGKDAIAFAKTKVDELKRIGEKNVLLSNRKYLQNLLTGNTGRISRSSLRAKFPCFSDKYFTLILIKPTQHSLSELYNSGFEENDVDIIFINIFEELLGENYSTVVIPVDDIYTCIVNSSENDIKSELMTICGKGAQAIEKYFGLQLYYASWFCTENPDELCIIFEKVMNELTFAEFMQLPAAEIHSGELQTDSTLISAKQKNDIISYLKCGNTEYAMCEFDKIISSALSYTPFPEFISRLKIEIVIITALVIDAAIPSQSDCTEEIVEFSNSIIKSETISELRYNISEYLKGLTVFTSNYTDEQESPSKIGESIIKFIQESYSDPNLCAGMICEKFGLHPVYLSRMFKERFKIGMLQYINEYRVKQATELLLQTDLSVEDILQKVGYTNIRTFNRCFKNLIGMTPTIYRKSQKKNM